MTDDRDGNLAQNGSGNLDEDREGKRLAIEVQDTFAAKFDAWYRTAEDDRYRSTFTWGRRRVEEVIKKEFAAIPSGARVLDVGCGTGYHVSRLRQMGFDVVGIEPGKDLRETARANNPGVQIDDGDIEAIPFPDGSFDAVLAIEVVRHLPHSPRRSIQEISRVLRPGGLAIVTAAPRWSLTGYALINMVTSRVQIPSFTKSKQSFTTEKEARRLLAEAGFTSVDVHGVALGPWQVVERVSPRSLPGLLRRFEPIDDRLSDRKYWRDLSTQLVLVGRK